MFGPFGGVRDLFDSNSEPLGEESQSMYFKAAAERSVDVNGDGFPDPFVSRPLYTGGGNATSVRVYVNPYDP